MISYLLVVNSHRGAYPIPGVEFPGLNHFLLPAEGKHGGGNAHGEGNYVQSTLQCALSCSLPTPLPHTTQLTQLCAKVVYERDSCWYMYTPLHTCHSSLWHHLETMVVNPLLSLTMNNKILEFVIHLQHSNCSSTGFSIAVTVLVGEVTENFKLFSHSENIRKCRKLSPYGQIDRRWYDGKKLVAPEQSFFLTDLNQLSQEHLFELSWHKVFYSLSCSYMSSRSTRLTIVMWALLATTSGRITTCPTPVLTMESYWACNFTSGHKGAFYTSLYRPTSF